MHVHGFSKLERVLFGHPGAEAVAQEAAAIDARRVFVISTRSLARERTYLDGIVAALGARHAGIFVDCNAHNPYEDVVLATAQARALQADLIVAVGGGSVMELAKMVLYALLHGLETRAQILAHANSKQLDYTRWPAGVSADAPRIVAVSTMLSAAEFNWQGGGTDIETGRKGVFGHPLMVPAAVILDPAATLTAPDALLVGTGIKAIDHAAERFCRDDGTPFSNAVSGEAAGLLFAGLEALRRDRLDMKARLDLLSGAFLSTAGKEEGVRVGLSHALGHVLGGQYGLPHGVTAGISLPAAMRWNRPVTGARQDRLALLLGRPGADWADMLDGLVAAWDLPGRLHLVGLRREDLPDIAQRVFEQHQTRGNPRPVTSAADATDFLELAW